MTTLEHAADLESPFREEYETDGDVLRRGSRGTAVTRLQAALTAAGFPTTVDGDFGPATERSVRAFQGSRGLVVDGVVGPATWSALGQSGGGGAGVPSAGQGAGDSAAGTPDVALGTLVVDAPGWPSLRYRFTGDDLIWTAKLLVHEAGGEDNPDNAAVLWAMFNRYALFTHRHYSTFSAFIRRYSTTLQPVLANPRAAARHAHKGDAVYRKTGGVYPGTNIPKGQLVRHLQIQQAPWSAVKRSARDLALRALTGQLPNPGIGQASEFASTRIYFKQRHKREPSLQEWLDYTHRFARSKKWTFVGDVGGINPRKNAFFRVNRVSHLPPDSVKVLAPGMEGETDPELPATELLEEFEDFEEEADIPGADGYDETYDGAYESTNDEVYDEADVAYDEAEDELEDERKQTELEAPYDDEAEDYASTGIGGGPGVLDISDSLEAEMFTYLGDQHALLVAVAKGERNANKLTDVVFYRRHPERGGRPIDRSEPGADRLIAEWLEIRRSVVAPVLARMADGATTPTAPMPPTPAPVTGDWPAIRAKAVEIGLGELRRWGDGARTESAMHSVITDYWRGSVGWLPKLKPGTSISSPAWSAVFVSWVMLKAGASPAFKPRGAHWLYVRDALDSGPAAPVQAFAPDEHRPRPGDIVVKWRQRSTDLETIRTASRKTRIPTHGDIVVEVTPTHLYVVGGNVANSVKRRKYGLSADGFWSHPARVAIVATGP